MQDRAAVFVEAMAFVAAVGVLAFLITWFAREPARQQAGGGAAERQAPPPRRFDLTLAVILLAAITAFAVWILSTSRQWPWGGVFDDWRSNTRAIIFAAVMVGLALAGLVASFVYTLVRGTPGAAIAKPAEAMAQAPPAPAEAVPAPAPARLLGVLGLAVALLLLCWIALPAGSQYRLVTYLIYPASFGVTLVLLLDKATRTWDLKRGAQVVREWLMCDLLAFVLVLAFLNLGNVAKPQSYAGILWDILNIVLFFVAFWVVDRSAARGRFLLGYGYLVVAPLLLLIWAAFQGVAGPASWWASMWPFLILAGVFFLLEVVALVAAGGERQALPAAKDTLFVVLYAALLIVAARS